jgi:hypothetical protein
MLPGDGLAQREAEDKLDPVTQLKNVNDAARAAYRAARERALASSGPIVLYNGDALTFRYGSYRRVSRPTSALYHDLKTVSHVVLGLHALIVPFGDGALDDRRLFELRQFREMVRVARTAIRRRDLTRAQKDRQEQILQACEGYLTGVLDNGKVEVRRLLTVLRRIQPSLDENATEAARAQIDGLHAEMMGYRKKLPAAAWKQLRVIVQGTQMPRKNHLAVQYFARLLGQPGEGERIIYAEALFDEAKALDLLGTHLVDTQVGKDIWNDSLHMHRDLLSGAARVYLDELFGKRE